MILINIILISLGGILGLSFTGFTVASIWAFWNTELGDGTSFKAKLIWYWGAISLGLMAIIVVISFAFILSSAVLSGLGVVPLLVV